MLEVHLSIGEDPGSVKLLRIFKILDRLSIKNGTSLQTVKRNDTGRIVSDPGQIRKLLAKVYTERLRSNRWKAGAMRSFV